MMASNRADLYCQTCKYWYPLEAFDRNNTRPRRGQPQCKECRDLWEWSARGIASRTISWIGSREPEHLHLWTLELCMERLERIGCTCTQCGNHLRAYTKGGSLLDRIDNHQPHVPDNCLFACGPCNITRGSMTLADFQPVIRGIRERYGNNKIPWQVVDQKRWRLNVPRRTAHLRAASPQASLALGVGR